jgi:hypothetical protein
MSNNLNRIDCHVASLLAMTRGQVGILRVGYPSVEKIQALSSPVHGLNQVTELFVDRLPFDLHGGGYFTVLLVEPLGQDGELLYLFHPGKTGVDLIHLFAYEPKDLGTLR